MAAPVPERVPAASYWRTARSPRMVLLLVLLLVAAAVCARLGAWQLDRAKAQGQAQEQVRQRQVESQPAVPLDELLKPQTSFPGELVGRRVDVSGAFEPDQVLVPGRALGDRTGYLVVTPLRVGGASGGGAGDAASAAGAGDGGDGAVLAVVRGWVPDRAAADALAPAPEGTVAVTGFLQAGEAGSAVDLPPGEVGAISPGALVNRWGGPIYSAYLVLSTVSPGQDPALALLPAPSLISDSGGSGLNLQNLAYALQWWIFGGFALLLWGRIVRDETRAQREADGGGSAAVSPDRTAGDVGVAP
ncbi:MAG TPA: SURF1 family protein [Actinotalea sp.]